MSIFILSSIYLNFLGFIINEKGEIETKHAVTLDHSRSKLEIKKKCFLHMGWTQLDLRSYSENWIILRRFALIYEHNLL